MVPHATADRRRSSVSPNPNGTYKFPDLSHDAFASEALEDFSQDDKPKPLPKGLPHGLHSSERWPARRASNTNNWSSYANGAPGKMRHGRQKSLTEAIKTVRGRKASISENAHEIAESLKAPVSWKLVILCGVWYTTSIMTNASSKAILTALKKPVTLTIVQFLLVSFWCIFLSWVAKHNRTLRDIAPFLKNGIRKPSKEIILVTLPLTAFQIGGHILNSDAMSKIPVSLVHTIKGLSPLMTVVAYRVFYNIRYSTPTYLSLVPLTVGVCMACAADTTTNFFGLLNAFGSAVLFVTQNIVSKKIFNEAAKSEADGLPAGRRKPDKLNLLCYSSALAFLITVPIWIFSEGWSLAQDFMQDASITLREKPGSLDHGALAAEFLFNGTFHFAQSLVAFVLLGLTSPVTYSVASLMKRVAVIIFAIVWFGNPMTYIQGAGFALTFLGLYLYDRNSENEKADKRARAMGESGRPLLPINVGDEKKNDPAPAMYTQSPLATEDTRRMFGGASGYADVDYNGHGQGRARSSSRPSPAQNGMPYSLPVGTKAEETWRQTDVGTPPLGIGVR
jgi:solute carrier family 35 protein E1